MREITVSEMHESETVKIAESYRSKKSQAAPQIRAYVKEKGTNKFLKPEPKQSLKPYLSKTVRKFENWGPEIYESEGQLLSHVQTYAYIHIIISTYAYVFIFI